MLKLTTGFITSLILSVYSPQTANSQSLPQTPLITDPTITYPINPYPPTNNYPLSNSFGNTSQCGLSINANQSFQNTGSITQIGISYSANKCSNLEKIEQIKLNNAIDIKKIESQTTTINQCIQGRTQAVVAGKNPNLVCSKPF